MKRGDKFKGIKKDKTVRIEFRVPEWIIPAIEEYQHDNDIHGTRQAVMLSMIKMASRINTLRKEVRKNPKIIDEIRKATDNNMLIDIIYGKNIDDYDLGVFIDSASTVQDIREGKIRV